MKEIKEFQTESKQLLNLMINSIYSNKEIFLRELISNASDAIDKYKFLAFKSEGKYPQKDYQIELELSKKEKCISIRDNGIGMNKEAIEKNLGTIASSGTKEFLEKYKDFKDKKDIDLIGQFGVGFYSAFMVGKKIEVYTKTVDDKEYLFTSDGVDSYSIEEIDKPDLGESGTLIKIYLKDDEEEEKYSEYLEEYKIKSLVKRYSDFIRYPIKMEVTSYKPKLDKDGKEIKGESQEVKEIQTLNSMIPIWKKAKKDVTDEDLNNFYKSRFNDYEDPLISLFIKAEGAIEYNSLVFIPSHVPYNLYSANYEKGLALYAKGIFIEERNKELIPDFLKFTRGLVDSEDIPLNISREMIQKAPVLDKIANNIEKKIVDKLKEIKKDDYDKYLKFFKVYGDFIKYGIYSSYGIKKDELEDLLVFNSLTSEKEISLEDYVSSLKEGNKVIYYATSDNLDSIKLLPQLEKYRKDNTNVLFLVNSIDEFCIQMMQKYKDYEFKNIASESQDDLSKEEKEELDDLSTTYRRFLDNVKESLSGKVDDVVFSSKLVDSPVCLTTKEGLSLNMEHVLNEENPNKEGEKVKASKILEINPNHELFTKIKDNGDDEYVKKVGKLLYQEALLLEGYEVENKSEFVKTLNELLIK
ncbi:MAG: molecular chaperone HtpG [Bacilli bacterium]|nr:molecular chaperone HtpG [Bacilli bacterium]